MSKLGLLQLILARVQCGMEIGIMSSKIVDEWPLQAETAVVAFNENHATF